MAFIGTDQKFYVGACWWLIEGPVWTGQIDRLPTVSGQFTGLGGAFIGRPLIVPDPSDATRTFFFALGRNNKIYWKYCEQALGAGPGDAHFTPQGDKWVDYLLPTICNLCLTWNLPA